MEEGVRPPGSHQTLFSGALECVWEEPNYFCLPNFAGEYPVGSNLQIMMFGSVWEEVDSWSPLFCPPPKLNTRGNIQGGNNVKTFMFCGVKGCSIGCLEDIKSAFY